MQIHRMHIMYPMIYKHVVDITAIEFYKVENETSYNECVRYVIARLVSS
jgi:hypothetical protein